MGSRLDQNSSAVRKRIQSHVFSDEAGDEYEGSSFGGFPEYFRRKKIKLQNLDAEIRAAAPDKPPIFKGVVAHVSGYTQPPLHVLHKALVQHGAGFLQYLDSKTMATHIIASTMPPKKALEFKNYRIVNPAWVMESIEAGKLLPWADFRVLDEGPRQKTLKFEGDKLSSQATQQSPGGYRQQSEKSFYASQLRKVSGRSVPLETSSNASPYQATRLSVVSSPTVAAEDLRATTPSSPEEALVEEHDPTTPTKITHSQAESVLKPSMKPSRTKTTESNANLEPMTSEEHNALLLADPHMRKSSTANPDFLKQYYSESRLHHLSIWKAELKSKMQKLAAEKGPGARPLKRKPGSRRYVMHVDFDSFFCAVSLKKAPEYFDKPTVVAHGSGSGSEIASCNYPARKFGIKNGMWMKRAMELCRDLKVLPYDFPGYEQVSEQFYAAIIEVGGTVQSVSIDEALVDITALVLGACGTTGNGLDEGSVWREQAKADEIASRLRERIKQLTGCHVSVGIGGNILLAKVALRRAKPAGQCQIKPEEVLDLLGSLKVEELPGVAYSITGKLEEIGVKFVKDIRETSKERLFSVLGPKLGERLWDYSRGIDLAEVGDQPVRKSVSAEVNWGIRFTNQEEAERFIYDICGELEKRLLNEAVKGKQFQLKIMRRAADAPLDPPKHLGHGKCDTFSKSMLFGVATNNGEHMGKEAIAMLRSYKFSPGDLRGIGVSMMKLEPLKLSTTGPDGSQKKLFFGKPDAVRGAKQARPEAIEDDGSPEKRKGKRSNDDDDPIADDPMTPRKPRMHPAIALAKAREADDKARTPLNIAGTQFVLPANADPAILAELPQDIRSRLMAQGRRPAGSRDATPSLRSRSQSPALFDEIPPDVDVEVFQSLPQDVQAEILAAYRTQKAANLHHQSPRADRIINRPKKVPTPTKRGTRVRARERQADASAGLYQTNFARPAPQDVGLQDDHEAPDDLDSDFLAELPEDVRQEVIAEHKRQRLAQKSGLNMQARKARPDAPAAFLKAVQSKIEFPVRGAPVTFNRSTSVKEISDMLEAWHTETREDGPHKDDVEVLDKYLRRVVLEERDMDKARKLVSWLNWMVDEDVGDLTGQRKWRKAVDGIMKTVQNATRTRGLAPMTFD